MSDKPRRASRNRSNPFQGFIDVMSEMNRVESQWMLEAREHGRSSHGHAPAYVPTADIFAVDENLIVRCELPGVRLEDVSATVSGGVLTIAAYRDSELDDDKVSYYCRERVFGPFRRTMILPEGIDQSAISASMRNGVLEIKILGAGAGKPHKIDIVDEDED